MPINYMIMPINHMVIIKWLLFTIYLIVPLRSQPPTRSGQRRRWRRRHVTMHCAAVQKPSPDITATTRSQQGALAADLASELHVADPIAACFIAANSQPFIDLSLPFTLQCFADSRQQMCTSTTRSVALRRDTIGIVSCVNICRGETRFWR